MKNKLRAKPREKMGRGRYSVRGWKKRPGQSWGRGDGGPLVHRTGVRRAMGQGPSENGKRKRYFVGTISMQDGCNHPTNIPHNLQIQAVLSRFERRGHCSAPAVRAAM